ncbi:integrase, catalytic region, zinc finger, CCHC-type containing protein [Tanacetum coccineum]
MRYVDTKANKNELRHCTETGPYILTELVTEAVPATEDQPGHPRRVEQETYANTTPENIKLIDAEAEAIYVILSGNGDDIYSTVDACSTAREMWLAIKRLQQGESINKQDMKTKFWEFEWSRFVTIVKQQQDLDTVSYHRLFDILKQHQNEVNEIRAEKIARNANPLALVAAAQHYPDKYSLDTYYQAPKPQKTHTSSSRHTSSTSSHATTRNKSKEIAKLITPPSESPSDKDMDTSLISENDKQTGQFGNQRTVTVARARETVGNQVIQQTRIQCFNFKEYGHFAKECRKPKMAKDYAYHKEKMMLCKQEEKGVPLSAEHGDWLADTDEVG